MKPPIRSAIVCGSLTALALAGSACAAPALDSVPSVYQPNYFEGYDAGYALGYESGFPLGYARGEEEGTAQGADAGFTAGWDAAYQPAYDVAFAQQYALGVDAGFVAGVPAGFDDGWSWAEAMAAARSDQPGAIVDVWNSNGSGVIMSDNINFIGGAIINYGGGTFGGTLTVTASPIDYDWSAHYFDLGFSEGKSSGDAEGSLAGYDQAFPLAYAAAFDASYAEGTDLGASEGGFAGGAAGFDSGWSGGFDEGHAVCFDAGVEFYLRGDLTLLTAAGFDLLDTSVPEPTAACLGWTLAAALPALRRRLAAA
jgi:hypothetical protein